MIEVSALQNFLERALCHRKERYLDFIARPKARGKFLEAIYHDLEDCFDSTCCVEKLPDAILDSPALRYAPPKEFGTPVSNLR